VQKKTNIFLFLNLCSRFEKKDKVHFIILEIHPVLVEEIVIELTRFIFNE
jgi:hypothetical protein